MTRLLVVHHTPSPHCQEMFEAVVAGATDRKNSWAASNLEHISGPLEHYLGEYVLSRFTDPSAWKVA